MKFFIIIARITALKLIRIYQKTLSFDHGLPSYLFPHGFCRFHPTCSEYAYQAIEKYGLIKGGFKALHRVLRCNPFSKGGNDPVD
ncbi:MAG: membrane protein insertion efficiency factor YidD [Patescibacteria group bacterium]|nr:membrane protein insertion efficiency factor YidD [Patescibacteria group bacterium]